MSLDLSIIRKATEEEKTLSILDSNYDFRPGVTPKEEVEVWSKNITHNLGTMAKAVMIGNGITLYHYLWRPEEIGFLEVNEDYKNGIHIGYEYVKNHPELNKYDAPNGWGTYHNLLNFVRSLDYLLQGIIIEEGKYKIYASR